MIGDLKIALIVGAGVMALATGAYWFGRWDGSSACDNRHEKAALDDYKKRTEDAEKKARELEGDLTKAREYSQKMERLVQYEIGKNSVYNSCVMPPDGVRIINEAIEGNASR